MQISKMKEISNAFEKVLCERKENKEIENYEINFIPDDSKIEMIIITSGIKVKADIKAQGSLTL